MQKKTIFEIKGLYRDDFRVDAFSFGRGEKSLAVVGALRGNENQQLLVSAILVNRLRRLEMEGAFVSNREVLVIPCGNPYSVNIKKRFWPIDNTDINRMFPGYDRGETTQRIAAGIFETVKDYRLGIQFASNYMAGSFVPHVRMMKTGYEDVEKAREFGLPYVLVYKTRPFDTTTLNYNWQIWETSAFSLYTTNTERTDLQSAEDAVEAIIRFMKKEGILKCEVSEGMVSRLIYSEDGVSLKAPGAGFFMPQVKAGERVEEGQLLARIRDTFTYDILTEFFSPCDGTIGFLVNDETCYGNTTVIKIIRDED